VRFFSPDFGYWITDCEKFKRSIASSQKQPKLLVNVCKVHKIEKKYVNAGYFYNESYYEICINRFVHHNLLLKFGA
jgi:hypothetical protein